MLSREDILRGLGQLDDRAKKSGVIVELSLYGGAALALAFDLRQATRDVDAVVHGAPDFLRDAVREIADAEGWPEDWLNDGVKGFLAAEEEKRLIGLFSASPEGGLRVFVPTPEYLFAMKCMAMRPEGLAGSHDISDIEALADIAGIADVETAFALVETFYPAARISPKVKFGLEEIMERISERRKSK